MTLTFFSRASWLAPPTHPPAQTRDAAHSKIFLGGKLARRSRPRPLQPPPNAPSGGCVPPRRKKFLDRSARRSLSPKANRHVAPGPLGSILLLCFLCSLSLS